MRHTLLVTARPLALIFALVLTGALLGLSACGDAARDGAYRCGKDGPCDDIDDTNPATQRFGANFPGELAEGLPEHNTSPNVSDTDVQQAISDNTAFAFDFFNQSTVGDSARANTFFSPYSISVAFAMALESANTIEPIQRNLNFTLPPETLHPAMNRIALDLGRHADATSAGSDAGDPLQLNLANGVWVDPELAGPPSPETVAIFGEHYNAPVALMPIGSDPTGAEAKLNAWVAERTFGLIDDLLTDKIKPTHHTALINAIAFKGSWAAPFTNTFSGPFTTLDGREVQTDTLSNELINTLAATTDTYDAVSLPYTSQNNAVEMLIIAPRSGTFETFQQSFTPDVLADIDAAMNSRTLMLRVPKFTITGDFDLSDLLEDPFSNAFHKAIIEIDEKGTTAAAATAVLIGDNGAPIAGEELHIDRPFIFLIRDRETGTILFMGRFTTPG